MGVKNDLIDITDETTNTNSKIYETFDTRAPASLFFAKTPVHSAEHEGLYRIFADLIFADAVQYRESRESFRAYTVYFQFETICMYAHMYQGKDPPPPHKFLPMGL